MLASALGHVHAARVPSYGGEAQPAGAKITIASSPRFALASSLPSHATEFSGHLLRLGHLLLTKVLFHALLYVVTRPPCSVLNLLYRCKKCRTRYEISFDDERMTRDGQIDTEDERRFLAQGKGPPGLCPACRPLLAAGYIRTAHSNYCAARHLHATGRFTAEAVYLAAQAAEKAIKALLVLERGQAPRGHGVSAIDTSVLEPYVPQEDWAAFTAVKPAAEYLSATVGPRQERARYPDLRYELALPTSVPSRERRRSVP